MKYRPFGKLDFKVSALGFGAMRLPTRQIQGPGNRLDSSIDEQEAIRMIRHAIDMGVNYIDTAYGYHGGQSEILVGKALMDGYRSRTALATKSPVWLIKEPADFDRLLDEQLGKLQTDYIDFYLLHAINGHSWENTILKHDVLSRMEAARKAGKIRHMGFSFHGDYDSFVKIVDGFDKWDFCQIQYNYMDIENQAGMKGLKYAVSKGLAVVIMEPLLGGRLANPPSDVRTIMEEADPARSPVGWALNWLWSQPEVSVVLSGMSTMRQLEENIALADKAEPGKFGKTELDVIEKVRRKYMERTAIPCTGCEYCVPCPNDVAIPRNFSIYNDGVMHDDMEGARVTYNNFFSKENRAGNCVRCGECEEKCPQGIAIMDWLEKVDKALSR
ncbi:MAG: aldo/keto reductase [Clostridiaceae bacterium]|jgi:predicted aldo/keto reductase-like oxidoreductase|nr:aldo/keto reductase [Clostridiaceae bacterium]